MLYYRTDDNRGKVVGIAAAVGYILFWVALMLFWSFTFERPDTGVVYYRFRGYGVGERDYGP